MNRMKVLLSGSFVAAVFFGAACSSSDPATPDAPSGQKDSGTDTDTGAVIDDDGGPSKPVPADTAAACKALGTAICAKMESCAPFALRSLYGDRATCEARNVLGCEAPNGASGREASADDVNACASSLPSVSCDDFIARKLGSACTIPGTRKEGEACGDNSQCASTFCAKSSDASCGTCASPTADGDPCKSGACSDGLVCGEKKAVCRKPGTGKPGDSCAQLSDCDVAHGSGCNDLSKSCMTLEIAESGGPCGADSFAPSKYRVCPAAGTCSAAVNGQCTPAAADGESCSKDGPGCLLPAVCISGKCTLPAPSSCK